MSEKFCQRDKTSKTTCCKWTDPHSPGSELRLHTLAATLNISNAPVLMKVNAVFVLAKSVEINDGLGPKCRFLKFVPKHRGFSFCVEVMSQRRMASEAAPRTDSVASVSWSSASRALSYRRKSISLPKRNELDTVTS